MSDLASGVNSTDFSIAVRRLVPSDEYTEALSRELSIRFAGDRTEPIDTLYFGGGTPSRLGGAGVQQAIAAVRETFTLASDGELTIESPLGVGTTVTAEIPLRR